MTKATKFPRPAATSPVSGPDLRGRTRLLLAGATLCLMNTQIAEWTQSRIHDSCLSVYDCPAECRRRGKSGGLCKPILDHCGAAPSAAWPP